MSAHSPIGSVARVASLRWTGFTVNARVGALLAAHGSGTPTIRLAMPPGQLRNLGDLHSDTHRGEPRANCESSCARRSGGCWQARKPVMQLANYGGSVARAIARPAAIG